MASGSSQKRGGSKIKKRTAAKFRGQQQWNPKMETPF